MARRLGRETTNAGTPDRPGWSFEGANGTGMWATAGTLGFSVNGKAVGVFDPNGLLYGAFNEYQQAARSVVGGGTVYFVNQRLKWTNRIMSIPLGTSIVIGGCIEINMPASGTPIGLNNGSTTRAVEADGIFLYSWESLYAIHTPGGGPGEIVFRIATYNSVQQIPANWILIAACNGDNLTCRLADGRILPNNTTSNPNAGIQRLTDGTQVVRLDDGFSRASFDAKGIVGYSRVRSEVDANHQITDRGFVQTINGVEYMRIAHDNVNLLWMIGGATIWFVNGNNGAMTPAYDGVQDVGASGNRLKNIYLVNQPTVSSDETTKTNIRDLTKQELAAWSRVSPKLFNIGTDISVTAGLIAQDVVAAFEAEKLNAERYGLVVWGEDRKLSLRYGECMIFEMAYQRSLNADLKAQLARVNEKLGSILKALGMGGA